MVVKFDGELFVIVDYEMVKPGKGPAYLVTKVKNLKLGNSTEKRLQGSDSIEDVFLERTDMEYLYTDGPNLVFMDTKTYDQTFVPKDSVGNSVYFLQPNMKVLVTSSEGSIIGIELPSAVELKVTETEPSMKGATVTNRNKPAILETGYRVMVPPFIEIGTVVRIDTRTGEYLERAK
jgi:elongation factor P